MEYLSMEEKFVISSSWAHALAEEMKRYLITNFITGYNIEYVNSSTIYLPKYRSDAFRIVIGIDISDDYEKNFAKEFLKNVYEILRLSPVISVIRGKIVISDYGSLNIHDLFSIPDFRSIINHDDSNFSRIAHWSSSRFGRINLLVHLTGKDVSNAINPGYPVIWVLTKDDQSVRFCRKVIAFNRAKNDVEK
ncbi:MAG: hypothetical protein ACP5MB_04350 [bacterium]